jgi:magnesium transporter
MIEVFKTSNITGKLEKQKDIEKGVWINLISPSTYEIEKICSIIGITENLIRYPLDIQEKAHIDEEEDSVLIAVDVPVTENKDKTKVYTTLPLGMIIVRDDYFVTVSQSRVDSIDEIINFSKSFDVCTEKKSRLVYQILYRIAADYIRYMGYISKDIDVFEKNMIKSMKNKELLSLLDFEKTMIYFNASLKANQAVLQKIGRGKFLKLYEEDEEILDDTIIENRQAIEMVQTYSDILNGIIDIFGTIISNNLNNVMKFLTSVTIIIAIPTMIASFIGMNVEFPFATNEIGFYSVMLISVIVAFVISFWLKKKDML